MMKSLLVLSAIVVCTGILRGSQSGPQTFIDFGGARISLGMSQEQVEMNLEGNGRQLAEITYLGNPQNSKNFQVRIKSDKSSSEGQVIFANQKAIYVSYSFPAPRNPVELAQEIAGAISTLDSKVCVVSNFSSQGTGGSYSQSSFDCGPKTLTVRISEVIGGPRSTSVELTIGSFITGTK